MEKAQRVFTVLFALLIMLVCSVAWAQATATQPAEGLNWWKVILQNLMELVFTVLGLLATGFVTVLMKKYGFDTYTAKVNDLLMRGIGYAEQKSLNAAKLNGKPLESAEKLQLAINFIQEKAVEYKLPDRGKEWWEKKVEGWLGANKITTGASALLKAAAAVKPAAGAPG